MARSGSQRKQKVGSKTELADLFVHCAPTSWRWFGCKMMQHVITQALHASNAALSLSDMRGEDAPLVWISDAFTRLNGWLRIEAIGRNCRFLQAEASDPSAVYEMRRAINERAHSRCYLWNEGKGGDGFWTMLSIIPGRQPDEASAQNAESHCACDDKGARYIMGVQHRLTKEEMRFVFERVVSYRNAHWVSKIQEPPADRLNVVQLVAQPVAQPTAALAAPGPGLASTPEDVPAAPRAAEIGGALAQLEEECARLHGRQPTLEEATALLRDMYAQGGARDAPPVPVS